MRIKIGVIHNDVLQSAVKSENWQDYIQKRMPRNFTPVYFDDSFSDVVKRSIAGRINAGHNNYVLHQVWFDNTWLEPNDILPEGFDYWMPCEDVYVFYKKGHKSKGIVNKDGSTTWKTMQPHEVYSVGDVSTDSRALATIVLPDHEHFHYHSIYGTGTSDIVSFAEWIETYNKHYLLEGAHHMLKALRIEFSNDWSVSK